MNYRTFTATIDHGVTITFPSKPDESIRSMLKANGFRWNRSSWWRQRMTGAADFIAALDRKMNPKTGPDAPCWRCGNADGYFRHRGAATPVWCNACNSLMDKLDQLRPGQHWRSTTTGNLYYVDRYAPGDPTVDVERVDCHEPERYTWAVESFADLEKHDCTVPAGYVAAGLGEV
jgi:hypothetical protein